MIRCWFGSSYSSTWNYNCYLIPYNFPHQSICSYSSTSSPIWIAIFGRHIELRPHKSASTSRIPSPPSGHGDVPGTSFLDEESSLLDVWGTSKMKSNLSVQVKRKWTSKGDVKWTLWRPKFYLRTSKVGQRKSMDIQKGRQVDVVWILFLLKNGDIKGINRVLHRWHKFHAKIIIFPGIMGEPPKSPSLIGLNGCVTLLCKQKKHKRLTDETFIELRFNKSSFSFPFAIFWERFLQLFGHECVQTQSHATSPIFLSNLFDLLTLKFGINKC